MKAFLSKSISVLLTVAIMFSVMSFTFSVSADAAVCSVELDCSPMGKVTYDGKTMIFGSANNQTINVEQGTEITLTAVPYNSNYTFLYWINVETARVFSFDATYTFTVASYMKLEAVFCSVAPGFHYVTYLTTNNNILYGADYAVGSVAAHIDYVPTRDGFVWTGNWTYTPEQIAVDENNLLIYPIFEKSTETYTVAANVGGVQVSSEEHEFLELATVSAPSVYDGKNFSYWAIIDEENFINDTVSYYPSYTFYVTSDIELTAVYGDTTGNGIVTRIAGDNPNFTNGRVTIYAERSVSGGYSVIQHGVIITRNSLIGANKTSFVIDPNNTEIKKATSTTTENTGTYGVTMGNWPQQIIKDGSTFTVYPLVYVRSYVVVEDSQGNVTTVYSDIIHVVDYADHGYTGEFEGDYVEDPFA